MRAFLSPFDADVFSTLPEMRPARRVWPAEGAAPETWRSCRGALLVRRAIFPKAPSRLTTRLANQKMIGRSNEGVKAHVDQIYFSASRRRPVVVRSAPFYSSHSPVSSVSSLPLSVLLHHFHSNDLRLEERFDCSSERVQHSRRRRDEKP